ncbi:hypothetical protein RJ640_026007 [Escallonia rubra]|uniref:Uncharacterized protein n=1 Tax=Escallonia rubra TaxID=112253 RepID=A0AA88UVP6_9ASTE|nr:hypothetical protein RJ640_026007 [Escallonia rubra]
MTSSRSLDTSANFASSPFSFSKSFMTTSFSDLLTFGDAPTTATAAVGRGSLVDRIAERTGSGVPKFKSIPPPSLPLSPPVVSPSSYFVIPPGLSPTELLDSPVLLSSSHITQQQPLGVCESLANWRCRKLLTEMEMKLEAQKPEPCPASRLKPVASAWEYPRNY